ncbi:hypothetical protein EDB19DRAFT_1911944 [Suillus lakei]|nr:hypothetical protein EDB19DRAFT_1911944 [Suillus lakei]
MSDSSHSQSPNCSEEEQREMLQHCFPHAGYWFNMLPTHPFIHGIENIPPPPSTPPPYSACDPVHATNPVPMEVNARPAQQPVAISNITVSIPLNSGVIGGHVSRIQIRLPLDISFVDFFLCVCAKMDLDPADAELGYKFHTDHARDDPHQLSNEQQLHEALERGGQLICRSCTWETILELHNLKRPVHQAASATRGHHEDIGTSDQDATTLSFAAEFHELRNKLDCAKHPGKFCYINPISGNHEAQDIYKLTLWAKKIFLGEATYEKPPETAAFDHISKKHRVSSTTASQAGPSLPEIHIHLPPTITTQPLGDIGGQRQINTSRLFSTPIFSEDDEFIVYPPITEALQEMDITMPLLNMSQYKNMLISNGVAYVNGIIGISDDFFVDIIGMPVGVVHSFLAVAHRLIRWARKGKAREQSVEI